MESVSLEYDRFLKESDSELFGGESFWAYNAIYQGRLSSQQARKIGIFLKEIYLLERNPPTQTYFDVSG